MNELNKRATYPTDPQKWRAMKEELEAEKAITFFATSMITQTTLDEVLWDVVGTCISRLQFVDCVIYWLDQERGVLVQKAAYGPKSAAGFTITAPIEIPLGNGIVGSVAASGRPELIGDTTKDNRYIQDDALRLSEITVPILSDGRVIGVIDAEHPRLNFFKPRHLKILTTVATLCAQKIKQVDVEQAYQQTERQLLETNKRVAETKLMALRMQMNPHFIFNSLSSINHFVLKNDSENASNLLTKFSRLMRQVLDNAKTEWISLRSELNTLQIYMELERLRCDNSFEVRVEVSDDIDPNTAHVPPMLIQPYVENAIWHGLLPQKDGTPMLHIRCYKQHKRLVVEITDNGIGREASIRQRATPLTGHITNGVRLVEERLQLVNEMYGVEAQFTVNDRHKPDGQPAGTSVFFTLNLSHS